MISVGGVLLAITILALALSPPGRSHTQFTSVAPPARGALLEQHDHPEWRQFLMQAALRRADELNRLRELPDTPVRLPEIPQLVPEYSPPEFPEATKGPSEMAGLPTDQIDADPEETGSTSATSGATIPIDIGEPSSTELPVMPVEHRPATSVPVTGLPETAPPVTETSERDDRPKVVIRKRSIQPRAKASTQAQAPAQNEMPIPFNLLQAFFEALLKGPQAAAVKQPTASTASAKRRIKAKRPALIRSVSQ